MPIITCLVVGASAFIRHFGPESMGGRGDFRAKINAEIALTGISEDEIGRKVHISYRASRWTKRFCIQSFHTIQKENSFGFLAFL